MARGKIKSFNPDRAWLRREYIDHGRRIADIAAELGCHVVTLKRRLDEAGIDRRDERAGAVRPTRRAMLDLEQIKSLYLDRRLASDKIAAMVGCDTSTVLRTLRRAGVPIRHHNDTKRGSKARNRIDLETVRVVSLYRRPGQTAATVGQAFGVSCNVVLRVLREAGEPIRPAAPTKGKNAGERHPNWRPDLTPKERLRRRASQQIAWRRAVKERDNHTCQCCGSGASLHAHHIVPHATDRTKRVDLSNGMTLCRTCHQDFHREYGATTVDGQKLAAFISTRQPAKAA